MIKNLVYLAVFTFVIILSWIAFGIYHSYTTSTISSDTGILISPIPAHFDIDVVKNLKARKVVPADLSAQSPHATEAATTITPTQAQPTPTVPIQPSILPSPPPASNSAQTNI